MRVLAALALLTACALADPVGDAVDAVLKAFAAKQDLGPLAALEDPDPWVVADALCARREFDAALAFATSRTTKELEALPAYIRGRRERPVSDADLKRQAEVDKAYLSGDATTILDRTRDLAPTGDVYWIRMMHARGAALRATRDLNGSGEVFVAAARQAQKLGWFERAGLLYYYGGVSYSKGSYSSEAESAFGGMLGVAKECGDRRGTADALSNLARVADLRGELTKSLQLHKDALEIYRALGTDTIGSMIGLGSVHDQFGEQGAALDAYMRAWRAIDDNDAQAKMLRFVVASNIALVYHGLAEYGRALAWHRRASELAKSAGLRSWVEKENLALTLRAVGKPNEALPLQVAAHAHATEAGDRLAAATGLLNIAVTREQLGDLTGALRDLEAGRAQLLALGRDDRAIGAQRTIGDVLRQLGQVAKARRVLTDAVTKARALGSNGLLADALIDFGDAQRAAGDAEAALASFEEARTLDGGRPVRTAAATSRAALALVQLGRIPEAIARFDEAVAAVELLHWRARGLDAQTRSEYLASIGVHGLYANLADAHMRQGSVEAAFAALERGRARGVLDLLARSRIDVVEQATRRARARGDTKTVAAIEEVQAALRDGHRKAVELSLRTSRSEGKRKQEARGQLDETQRAQRQLLQRRAELLRSLLPQASPVEVATLRAILQSSERLVTYIIGADRSLALVLTPSGVAPHAHVLSWPNGKPVTQESLRARIDAWRETVVRPGRDRGVRPVGASPSQQAHAPSGDLLDALVPAAMRKQLKGVERLYVIPDGPLHRLPLEALDGWLGTLPQTVYGHSASVLHACRARRSEMETAELPFDVLALGDPVFRRDEAQTSVSRFGALPPLPGTRREVEAIAGAIPRTKALLGAAATEDALHELAPRARLLHLATHQLAEETPWFGNSRLALTAPSTATPESDGFLSLFDLFEHWRDRLSSCELVVLSACETATGPLHKDEGPYAMPLGFLYAGAPAVIGSLWRVNDASTAELFADFYKRLAKGTPKLQAFTEARLALKRKYPDPYHWGAFIYIGDPR